MYFVNCSRNPYFYLLNSEVTHHTHANVHSNVWSVPDLIGWSAFLTHSLLILAAFVIVFPFFILCYFNELTKTKRYYIVECLIIIVDVSRDIVDSEGHHLPRYVITHYSNMNSIFIWHMLKIQAKFKKMSEHLFPFIYVI